VNIRVYQFRSRLIDAFHEGARLKSLEEIESKVKENMNGQLSGCFFLTEKMRRARGVASEDVEESEFSVRPLCARSLPGK
jgi:hypothetical protein